MGTKVTLTRAGLYALVWEEPLSVLAKRYNLSDAAFRRVCIQLSIPLPRANHWTRVQTGQTITRPPLPSNRRGDQKVELTANTPEKAPGKQTRIAEDPLVTALRQHLQLRAKEWLHNGLARTRDGFLNVDVSPSQINAACNLLNELLHALKAKGYRVQVKGDETTVHIGLQPLPIRLREKTTRKNIRRPGSSYDSYQFVPTGNLALQMTAGSNGGDWPVRDRALPDEAADLVSKLERLSEDNHAQQVEHEAYWAERDKKLAAEQAIRDRRAAELKNFKDLLQAATRWRQAQWIRDYLTAMEKQRPPLDICPPATQSPDVNPSQPPASDPAAWLAWAHAKADWYDPLTEAPDEWLTDVNRNTLT
jgi:hypothetical protein